MFFNNKEKNHDFNHMLFSRKGRPQTDVPTDKNYYTLQLLERGWGKAKLKK